MFGVSNCCGVIGGVGLFVLFRVVVVECCCLFCRGVGCWWWVWWLCFLLFGFFVFVGVGVVGLFWWVVSVVCLVCVVCVGFWLWGCLCCFSVFC